MKSNNKFIKRHLEDWGAFYRDPIGIVDYSTDSVLCRFTDGSMDSSGGSRQYDNVPNYFRHPWYGHINDCVNKLNDQQRKVIRLKFVDDLCNRFVADRMGLSLRRVEDIIKYAYIALYSSIIDSY